MAHLLEWRTKNAGKLGLLKFENGGNTITGVCSLRPKQYSIQFKCGPDVKKSKGTPRCNVDQDLSFEDYVHCLTSWTQPLHHYNTFRSKEFQMHTVEAHRTSLSPIVNKRHLHEDLIHTSPFAPPAEKRRKTA
jgi:hypothetical protein